jgi:hypothetical protein
MQLVANSLEDATPHLLLNHLFYFNSFPFSPELSMWLDTNAMQAGDTIEVRIYSTIESAAGDLRLYRNDTISIGVAGFSTG